MSSSLRDGQQTGVCAKKFVMFVPMAVSCLVNTIAPMEPSMASWSSVSMKKKFGRRPAEEGGLGENGGSTGGNGAGAGVGLAGAGVGVAGAGAGVGVLNVAHFLFALSRVPHPAARASQCAAAQASHAGTPSVRHCGHA